MWWKCFLWGSTRGKRSWVIKHKVCVVMAPRSLFYSPGSCPCLQMIGFFFTSFPTAPLTSQTTNNTTQDVCVAWLAAWLSQKFVEFLSGKDASSRLTASMFCLDNILILLLFVCQTSVPTIPPESGDRALDSRRQEQSCVDVQEQAPQLSWLPLIQRGR